MSESLSGSLRNLVGHLQLCSSAAFFFLPLPSHTKASLGGVHAFLCAQMCVRTHVYVYTCMCRHACVCVQEGMCVHVYVFVCVFEANMGLQ